MVSPFLHEASLWAPGPDGRAVCGLCAHRCVVALGRRGVCGVRENRAGSLVTHAYGAVVAANVDPIEKKPLYHFLPGTTSLSIATAGCNFRCGFCQNWSISQSSAGGEGVPAGRPLAPERIVALAVERGCRSVSYTYTEPTIFFEYARDTGLAARASGLANVFVSNGYMTAEAVEAARPWLDAANVDLKAFRDATYRKVCGARLQPVLDSIAALRAAGVWIEVTTLVVPGLNDGEDELRDIARFLAGVGPDIPWHISRFHPDYVMSDRGPTPIETLARAAAIGRAEGLRYVYVGNVPGEGEATLCPACGAALIQRSGFSVLRNRIGAGGRCPDCGAAVAGRWLVPGPGGRR
jgi:pyruvate formate lyase activating enzyme